jgi:hypothetical protein
VVVDVFERVRLACLLGRQTAEGAERPLELGGGQRERELEQSLLGRRRCDARQRPDLRERELAAAEGFPNRRKLVQRLSHTHDLPRLAARDSAAERDVARGLVHQAALLRERVHELDEARGSSVDVRRERRELVIQASRLRCLHCTQPSALLGRTTHPAAAPFRDEARLTAGFVLAKRARARDRLRSNFMVQRGMWAEGAGLEPEAAYAARPLLRRSSHLGISPSAPRRHGRAALDADATV